MISRVHETVLEANEEAYKWQGKVRRLLRILLFFPNRMEVGSTENMTGNLVMMPPPRPQREMEALSLGLPPG